MTDLISRTSILEELERSSVYYGEEYSEDEWSMLAKFERYVRSLPSHTRWNAFNVRKPTSDEAVRFPNSNYMLEKPFPKIGKEILVTDGESVWIDAMYVLYGQASLNRTSDFRGLKWTEIPDE